MAVCRNLETYVKKCIAENDKKKRRKEQDARRRKQKKEKAIQDQQGVQMVQDVV